MPNVNTVITAPSVADLKTVNPTPGMIVFLLGRAAPYDGMGGHYRWDPNASETEDTRFIKSFPSDSSSSGRWVRVVQNIQELPQGVLVINGGIKTLYGKATTVSGGTASINLTLDGTSTGAAIFQEVWRNSSEPNANAATVNDVVKGGRKSLDANLKSTTHLFFKPNPVTFTLAAITAGLLFNPNTNAPSGIPILFEIEGI